ncbi:unnamed protein product [Symbiodinium microadriaticum]|nr:unnamed protein product [Symbiodinium microadriaticum]
MHRSLGAPLREGLSRALRPAACFRDGSHHDFYCHQGLDRLVFDGPQGHQHDSGVR